jgi:hypothetical protein
MRPNLRQIDEAVDLAQEVIVRDMTLNAEAVEQRLLHHLPFAHHRVSPRFTVKSESAAHHRGKRLFSTKSVDLTRSPHRLAMTAICAFRPAGVDVKRSSEIATTSGESPRSLANDHFSRTSLCRDFAVPTCREQELAQ